MYYPAISQFTQAFRNIDGWLDKAEQLAAAKKFDMDVLLTSRLAPDMANFIYQVQSASDYIKGAAALLAGRKPPPYPDTERTLAEVRERIRKTVAFVGSVPEAQYAKAAEQKVPVTWGHGKVLSGQDYLLQVAIPNIYFHIMAAYLILRHNGVEVGKMDFLRPINWIDP